MGESGRRDTKTNKFTLLLDKYQTEFFGRSLFVFVNLSEAECSLVFCSSV